MEVISNLIKIRLKPKVLLNHYMLCVRCVESSSLLYSRFYMQLFLLLTHALDAVLQGAAKRAQRQPGHNGEAGDL